MPTATTGYTPGSAPEPWSLAHANYDRSHCLPADLYDLPETVKARLGEGYDDALEQADIETLTELLADAVDELTESGMDKAWLTSLSADIDDLRAHRTCQCANDAWQGGLSQWFASQIEEVHSEMWAAFHNDGTPAGAWADAPSVTYLWSALGNRDGWDDVALAWDPTIERLNVTFGTDRGTFGGYLVPLTAEQVKLRFELDGLDDACPVEGPACLAAAYPLAAHIVVALWGDSGGTRWFTDLAHVYQDDVSYAVRGVHEMIADIDATTARALHTLAPGWQSTLEELLAVVGAVTAPAMAI